MTRSIIDELYDLNREMNRLFDQGRLSNSVLWPETNVYESRDDFVLVSKVPGLSKEEIEISVKDRSLTISGERKKGRSGENKIHLSERFTGSFSRTFKLNDSVNVDEIKAEANNGLLIIRVPKSPEAKPRKIEIN